MSVGGEALFTTREGSCFVDPKQLFNGFVLDKSKVAPLSNCRRRVYPAIVRVYSIRMKNRGPRLAGPLPREPI